MKFQLRSVILWPKNTTHTPRVVDFEPGKVNVIVGGSRTGKSAVIPIIDYCLASKECAIPKRIIRTSCSWFGVIINTARGNILLARRNPNDQKSTADMYIKEGNEIQIPDIVPDANTNTKEIKQMLDDLCALSHLDFAGGEVENGIDHRIGFRDLMAFIFQPQNIVANRDVLFYKTETYAHREKLRKNVLPYALEIVTPAILAAQHEQMDQRRKLLAKEKELQQAKAASSKWEAEIEGHIERAHELGLLSTADVFNADPEFMFSKLREIAQQTAENFNIQSGNISKAVEELVYLDSEEGKISNAISELKNRQTELCQLRDSAGGFKDAIVVQRDRLAISKWIDEKVKVVNGEAGCPICGHCLDTCVAAVDELKESLIEIENTASQIAEIPVSLDREVQHVKREIDKLTKDLLNVKQKRKTLTDSSRDAKSRQFKLLNVAHYLGELGQAIRLYDEANNYSGLGSEIEKIKADLNSINEAIDEAGIARRREHALRKISALIAQYMPKLDNDHPNDGVELLLDDLSIKIHATEGESYLWNIGSGSNWLSYHVATLLALQVFFSERKYSPVPGLLIFDQPSQVYFPEKSTKREAVEMEPQWDNDEDILAVRSVFKLLGEVVDKKFDSLQVIILDHAPESVWGKLPGVHLAANWRTGEKLVPSHWPGVEENA